MLALVCQFISFISSTVFFEFVVEFLTATAVVWQLFKQLTSYFVNS